MIVAQACFDASAVDVAHTWAPDAATAVASPAALTVTLLLSDELHVTVVAIPALATTVALSCRVSPICMVALDGLTETLVTPTGAVTVMATVLVMPAPAFAVMMVEPTATPCTTPLDETVATLVAALLHVTAAVIAPPIWSRAVTDSWVLPPTLTLAEAGAAVIAVATWGCSTAAKAPSCATLAVTVRAVASHVPPASAVHDVAPREESKRMLPAGTLVVGCCTVSVIGLSSRSPSGANSYTALTTALGVGGALMLGPTCNCTLADVAAEGTVTDTAPPTKESWLLAAPAAGTAMGSCTASRTDEEMPAVEAVRVTMPPFFGASVAEAPPLAAATSRVSGSLEVQTMVCPLTASPLAVTGCAESDALPPTTTTSSAGARPSLTAATVGAGGVTGVVGVAAGDELPPPPPQAAARSRASAVRRGGRERRINLPAWGGPGGAVLHSR